ncbi:Ras-related protein rabc1 [Asimina triloba]
MQPRISTWRRLVPGLLLEKIIKRRRFEEASVTFSSRVPRFFPLSCQSRLLCFGSDLRLRRFCAVGDFAEVERDSMDSSASQVPEFDYMFKLLLIGDSGVGKSSLLLSFTSNTFEDLSPTIAGQERFRTLTSSYYRGAQGVIMVYDVTRRETFTNLSEVWAKEMDLHLSNQDCIKMLVGNKVDKESERVVSKKEGIDFAREYGCLFLECSAKTRVNVEQCFEELVVKTNRVSLLSEVASFLVPTYVQLSEFAICLYMNKVDSLFLFICAFVQLSEYA